MIVVLWSNNECAECSKPLFKYLSAMARNISVISLYLVVKPVIQFKGMVVRDAPDPAVDPLEPSHVDHPRVLDGTRQVHGLAHEDLGV